MLERGYELVERNYRTRYEEIDRILRKDNTLVFVEGKLRRGSSYGGQFDGGKAQLRMVPKPAGNAGPPSGAQAKGEIYLDSAGEVLVCTAGGSSPAWRKVTTTAV